MSRTLLVAVFAVIAADDLRAAAPPVPNRVIGFTEFRTDLPGGRHANVRTMRAVVVNVDTKQRRVLAEDLVRDDPDASTQFVDWSPDGKIAVVGRGWQSQDNAKWEEKNQNFRLTKEGRSSDCYLI